MFQGLMVRKLPNEILELSGTCLVTGEFYAVLVKEKQFNEWIGGTVIQKAFPDMSVDAREFLICGISPKGFKKSPKLSLFDREEN